MPSLNVRNALLLEAYCRAAPHHMHGLTQLQEALRTLKGNVQEALWMFKGNRCRRRCGHSKVTAAGGAVDTQR